jgi:hypothetical protein
MSKQLKISVLFVLFLISCNIPKRTYYSCPLHTDKKGKLQQKLYKPIVLKQK